MKRRFLLLLANALYKWAALLRDKTETSKKEPPGSSGPPKGPVDGGPSAHWLELVRRHAPEFITYKVTTLENPGDSIDPEYGETHTETGLTGEPSEEVRVGPFQANPRPRANQPLDSSGKKEFSTSRGVVAGSGSAAHPPPEGGPPAHWVELVRQRAPEMLGHDHEDSVLGRVGDPLGPEHGEAKMEAGLTNDPPLETHAAPAWMSSRRFADQLQTPTMSKEFSTGRGEPDGFGAAKRGAPEGGPPAHWVELVRRRAPELLAHEETGFEKPTGSFVPEYHEVKPGTGSIDYPSATIDVGDNVPEVRPNRLGSRQNEAPALPVPIPVSSYPPEDELNLPRGREEGWDLDLERDSGKREASESKLYAASMPSEEEASVKRPPAASELKRPVLSHGEEEETLRRRKDTKKVETDAGSFPSRLDLTRRAPWSPTEQRPSFGISREEPGSDTGTRPSKKTADQEWPDLISLKEPVDLWSSEPETLSAGRKLNFTVEDQSSFITAKLEFPQADNLGQFNPDRAKSLSWPNLAGEPAGKDSVEISQDRWPTLLGDEADFTNRPLTEARQNYPATIRSRERICRLDQEQRGLAWKE